jgi:hypothetical protein
MEICNGFRASPADVNNLEKQEVPMSEITDNAAAVATSNPQPNDPDQPTNQSDRPNQEADQGGIANTTNVANVAPSSLQQAPQQQGPTPEQQAAVADIAHHALVGKSVKAVFNSLNNQTDDGGNVRPGSFFRNLIAGMMIGGANSGGGRGGALGGFARGGAAVINDQRAQLQQQLANQQKQQQEDLKNQMDRERLDDTEALHQSMVAHENIQTADLLHNMHSADDKTVEQHNAASRAYQKSLIDSGALPAQMSINGKMVDSTDGTSFQSSYIKDPSITTAPKGYVRHFISTTDLSELHYENGEWKDDSGNAVNIGKNISIRAYDQPTSNLKTPSMVKGSVINTARRQNIVDPNKSYSISPDAMSGIYTLGTKDAAQSARTNHEQNLTDQRNKNQKTFYEIEAKKASSLAKAEHEYWSAINKGTDKDSALSELNASKQQSQDAYEAEIKAAGGTSGHMEYSPTTKPNTGPTPKAPAPQVRVGQRVKLKNGDQVNVTKVNPNGTFTWAH